MVAFRFLALLTVGFVLLTFVFLLNVSNARLEREAVRSLDGEVFSLDAQQPITWTLDLGAPRVDEAWPSPQRQPRLTVRAAAGAELAARAEYRSTDGGIRLQALTRGERVVASAGEDGVLDFGTLWMSWEHPLTIELEVVDPGAGGEAQPRLAGAPARNFVAARAISRTLWLVFTVIGAMGFAVLVATQRNLFGSPRGAARA